MKRGTVSADASPDDDQIVVERLRRAPIVGQGGRDLPAAARPAAGGAEAARGRLLERGEPQGLAPQAAEPKVYRGRERRFAAGARSERRGREEGVGGEGEGERRLHFGTAREGGVDLR